MRAPIFVVSASDVLPFRSREDAERYVAAVDVERGIYEAFDSAGERFDLRAAGQHVALAARSPAVFDAAALKGHLIRALSMKYERAMLEKRHLKELVRFASNFFISVPGGGENKGNGKA